MAKQESRFALRLPTNLYELAKKRAEQAGISMNELFVVCIDEHLNRIDWTADRYVSLEERKLITLEERVRAIEEILRPSQSAEAEEKLRYRRPKPSTP